MRYALLVILLLGLGVVALAGKRGRLWRQPPIEVFPDMDRQPKLRPQAGHAFFPDGFSSRRQVPGTVARSEPLLVGGVKVFPHQDHPLNTGRAPGTTNFVHELPLPLTAPLLDRGRERYQIHCAPCHGATGEGRGIMARLGLVGVADLHQVRLVPMADGELFQTITHGKNLMGPYGAELDPPDRWAVIAYLRALQRARLGSLEDVPAGERAQLTNGPPAAP